MDIHILLPQCFYRNHKYKVHFQEMVRDVFCRTFEYHAKEATQGASQRNVGE